MFVVVLVIVVDDELVMGRISTDLLIPNKLHFNILRLLLGPAELAVEAAKATAAAALAAAKLAEDEEEELELLPAAVRLSLSKDFCGEGVALLLFDDEGSFGRAVIVTALELNCLVSLSTDKLRERGSCCCCLF